jgi:hypothetical protein
VVAFWAAVILAVSRRRRARGGAPIVAGYLAGWAAMTALSVWISSRPRGAEHSCTLGAAIVLTPLVFLPIYGLSRWWWRPGTGGPAATR